MTSGCQTESNAYTPGDCVIDTEESALEANAENELLKLYRDNDGIVSTIERMPLLPKLIVICSVWATGLILFIVLTLVYTGQLTKQSISRTDGLWFMNRLDRYVVALQKERELTMIYLSFSATTTPVDSDIRNRDMASNLDVITVRMKEAIEDTTMRRDEILDEQSLKFVHRNEPSKIRVLSSYIDRLRNVVPNDDLHRENLLLRKVSSHQNLLHYQSLIHHVLLFKAAVFDIGGMGSRGTTNPLLVSRLIEATEQLRMGSIWLQQVNTSRHDVVQTWISYVNEFEIHEKQLLTARSCQSMGQLLATTCNADSMNNCPLGHYELSVIHSQIVNSLLTNDYDGTSRSTETMTSASEFQQYRNVLADVVGVLRMMEEALVETITDESQSMQRQSIAGTIIYSVLAFLFLIAAFTATILLSMAIITPWKRLNWIQAEIVSKFVPHTFLALLGFRHVTDVQVGVYAKREKLTVMEVEILNFDHMSSRMSDEAEVFRFLNRYLSRVGPLVHKYNGFIQLNRGGQKFTALFRHAVMALRASVEIQEAIDVLNAEQHKLVDIRLGIGIHCDTALIGTLGHNERLNCTLMLSRPHSHMRAKLRQVMSNNWQFRTLVTKSVVACCPTSAVPVRKIGYIPLSVHRQALTSERIGVYEVLHPGDRDKIAKLDTFKRGMKLYLRGRYREAQEHFVQASKQQHTTSERDMIAELYAETSLALHEKASNIVQPLQIHDILQDEVMRESLEQFCLAEKSEENISIWKLIQEYRTLKNPKDRIRFALEMYNNFLSFHGAQAINVSDRMRTDIWGKVENDDVLPVDESLFDDMEREIEVLMGTDTLSRFKASAQFQEDFVQCSFGVKPLSLEELL